MRQNLCFLAIVAVVALCSLSSFVSANESEIDSAQPRPLILRMHDVLVKKDRGLFRSDAKHYNPLFPQFEKAGVPEDKIDRIHIGIPSQGNPKKESVKNIAAFFPGQQGMSLFESSGKASCVVGTSEDFKKALEKGIKHDAPNPRSLVAKVWNSELFPITNTHYMVALEHAFYYESAEETRRSIEDAFFRYIRDVKDLKQVDQILLAGVSRGGTLAFRIAKRLRSGGFTGKLVIVGLDSVARDDEVDQQQNKKAYNPLDHKKDMYCFPTSFNTFFPLNMRKNLHVYTIQAGGAVRRSLSLVMPVRCFVDISKASFVTSHWVLGRHTDINRNYDYCEKDVVDPALKWMRETCKLH